jgi:hypothetical protein
LRGKWPDKRYPRRYICRDAAASVCGEVLVLGAFSTDGGRNTFPRKVRVNCRSLGCARDDKGEGGASMEGGCWARATSVQRLLSMEASPFPLSSRPGFPATLHRTRSRVRLSLKERRMRSVNATKFNRKSGGAQPRDLQFTQTFRGNVFQSVAE